MWPYNIVLLLAIFQITTSQFSGDQNIFENQNGQNPETDQKDPVVGMGLGMPMLNVATAIPRAQIGAANTLAQAYAVALKARADAQHRIIDSRLRHDLGLAKPLIPGLGGFHPGLPGLNHGLSGLSRGSTGLAGLNHGLLNPGLPGLNYGLPGLKPGLSGLNHGIAGLTGTPYGLSGFHTGLSTLTPRFKLPGSSILGSTQNGGNNDENINQQEQYKSGEDFVPTTNPINSLEDSQFPQNEQYPPSNFGEGNGFSSYGEFINNQDSNQELMNRNLQTLLNGKGIFDTNGDSYSQYGLENEFNPLPPQFETRNDFTSNQNEMNANLNALLNGQGIFSRNMDPGNVFDYNPSVAGGQDLTPDDFIAVDALRNQGIFNGGFENHAIFRRDLKAIKERSRVESKREVETKSEGKSGEVLQNLDKERPTKKSNFFKNPLLALANLHNINILNLTIPSLGSLKNGKDKLKLINIPNKVKENVKLLEGDSNTKNSKEDIKLLDDDSNLKNSKENVKDFDGDSNINNPIANIILMDNDSNSKNHKENIELLESGSNSNNSEENNKLLDIDSKLVKLEENNELSEDNSHLKNFDKNNSTLDGDSNLKNPEKKIIDSEKDGHISKEQINAKLQQVKINETGIDSEMKEDFKKNEGFANNSNGKQILSNLNDTSENLEETSNISENKEHTQPQNEFLYSKANHTQEKQLNELQNVDNSTEREELKKASNKKFDSNEKTSEETGLIENKHIKDEQTVAINNEHIEDALTILAQNKEMLKKHSKKIKDVLKKLEEGTPKTSNNLEGVLKEDFDGDLRQSSDDYKKSKEFSTTIEISDFKDSDEIERGKDINENAKEFGSIDEMNDYKSTEAFGINKETDEKSNSEEFGTNKEVIENIEEFGTNRYIKEHKNSEEFETYKEINDEKDSQEFGITTIMKDYVNSEEFGATEETSNGTIENFSKNKKVSLETDLSSQSSVSLSENELENENLKNNKDISDLNNLKENTKPTNETLASDEYNRKSLQADFDNRSKENVKFDNLEFDKTNSENDFHSQSSEILKTSVQNDSDNLEEVLDEQLKGGDVPKDIFNEKIMGRDTPKEVLDEQLMGGDKSKKEILDDQLMNSDALKGEESIHGIKDTSKEVQRKVLNDKNWNINIQSKENMSLVVAEEEPKEMLNSTEEIIIKKLSTEITPRREKEEEDEFTERYVENQKVEISEEQPELKSNKNESNIEDSTIDISNGNKVQQAEKISQDDLKNDNIQTTPSTISGSKEDSQTKNKKKVSASVSPTWKDKNKDDLLEEVKRIKRELRNGFVEEFKMSERKNKNKLLEEPKSTEPEHQINKRHEDMHNMKRDEELFVWSMNNFNPIVGNPNSQFIQQNPDLQLQGNPNLQSRYNHEKWQLVQHPENLQLSQNPENWQLSQNLENWQISNNPENWQLPRNPGFEVNQNPTLMCHPNLQLQHNPNLQLEYNPELRIEDNWPQNPTLTCQDFNLQPELRQEDTWQLSQNPSLMHPDPNLQTLQNPTIQSEHNHEVHQEQFSQLFQNTDLKPHDSNLQLQQNANLHSEHNPELYSEQNWQIPQNTGLNKNPVTFQESHLQLQQTPKLQSEHNSEQLNPQSWPQNSGLQVNENPTLMYQDPNLQLQQNVNFQSEQNPQQPQEEKSQNPNLQVQQNLNQQSEQNHELINPNSQSNQNPKLEEDKNGKQEYNLQQKQHGGQDCDSHFLISKENDNVFEIEGDKDFWENHDVYYSTLNLPENIDKEKNIYGNSNMYVSAAHPEIINGYDKSFKGNPSNGFPILINVEKFGSNVDYEKKSSDPENLGDSVVENNKRNPIDLQKNGVEKNYRNNPTTNHGDTNNFEKTPVNPDVLGLSLDLVKPIVDKNYENNPENLSDEKIHGNNPVNFDNYNTNPDPQVSASSPPEEVSGFMLDESMRQHIEPRTFNLFGKHKKPLFSLFDNHNDFEPHGFSNFDEGWGFKGGNLQPNGNQHTMVPSVVINNNQITQHFSDPQSLNQYQLNKQPHFNNGQNLNQGQFIRPFNHHMNPNPHFGSSLHDSRVIPTEVTVINNQNSFSNPNGNVKVFQAGGSIAQSEATSTSVQQFPRSANNENDGFNEENIIDPREVENEFETTNLQHLQRSLNDENSEIKDGLFVEPQETKQSFEGRSSNDQQFLKSLNNGNGRVMDEDIAELQERQNVDKDQQFTLLSNSGNDEVKKVVVVEPQRNENVDEATRTNAPEFSELPNNGIGEIIEAEIIEPSELSESSNNRNEGTVEGNLVENSKNEIEASNSNIQQFPEISNLELKKENVELQEAQNISETMSSNIQRFQGLSNNENAEVEEENILEPRDALNFAEAEEGNILEPGEELKFEETKFDGGNNLSIEDHVKKNPMQPYPGDGEDLTEIQIRNDWIQNQMKNIEMLNRIRGNTENNAGNEMESSKDEEYRAARIEDQTTQNNINISNELQLVGSYKELEEFGENKSSIINFSERQLRNKFKGAENKSSINNQLELQMSHKQQEQNKDQPAGNELSSNNDGEVQILHQQQDKIEEETTGNKLKGNNHSELYFKNEQEGTFKEQKAENKSSSNNQLELQLPYKQQPTISNDKENLAQNMELPVVVQPQGIQNVDEATNINAQQFPSLWNNGSGVVKELTPTIRDKKGVPFQNQNSEMPLPSQNINKHEEENVGSPYLLHFPALRQAFHKSSRWKRSLPLVRLMADPNAKLDMPKTLENVGAIAKNSFEDKRAPMYHVKNMIGATKDAILSTLKIAPQNVIIPSRYKIVDTKEEIVMKPNELQRIKNEARDAARSEFENVGSGNPVEKVIEGVRKFPTLKEFFEKVRSNGGNILPKINEDLFRRNLFARPRQNSDSIVSGLNFLKPNVVEESVDDTNFLDTFQKVGSVIRDSIKSSQETVAHINNVAHSARKAYTTSKFSLPRILLPYTNAPVVRNTLLDDNLMMISPRFLDVTEEDVNKPDFPSEYVKMGEIMDAFGVSKPGDDKVGLSRIIIQKRKESPLLQSRFGEEENEVIPTGKEFYVISESVDNPENTESIMVEAFKSLRDIKEMIGAHTLRDFLEEMKREFNALRNSKPKMQARINYEENDEDTELRRFLNDLFGNNSKEERYYNNSKDQMSGSNSIDQNNSPAIKTRFSDKEEIEGSSKYELNSNGEDDFIRSYLKSKSNFNDEKSKKHDFDKSFNQHDLKLQRANVNTPKINNDFEIEKSIYDSFDNQKRINNDLEFANSLNIPKNNPIRNDLNIPKNILNDLDSPRSIYNDNLSVPKSIHDDFDVPKRNFENKISNFDVSKHTSEDMELPKSIFEKREAPNFPLGTLKPNFDTSRSNLQKREIPGNILGNPQVTSWYIDHSIPESIFRNSELDIPSTAGFKLGVSDFSKIKSGNPDFSQFQLREEQTNSGVDSFKFPLKDIETDIGVDLNSAKNGYLIIHPDSSKIPMTELNTNSGVNNGNSESIYDTSKFPLQEEHTNIGVDFNSAKTGNLENLPDTSKFQTEDEQINNGVDFTPTKYGNSDTLSDPSQYQSKEENNNANVTTTENVNLNLNPDSSKVQLQETQLTNNMHIPQHPQNLPPIEDFVGSSMNLPTNLFQPFMNQPTKTELEDFFRDQGDDLTDITFPNTPDNMQDFMKLTGLVTSINPDIYMQLFNESLNVEDYKQIDPSKVFKVVEEGNVNLTSINNREVDEEDRRTIMDIHKSLLKPFMGKIKKKVKEEMGGEGYEDYVEPYPVYMMDFSQGYGDVEGSV